MSDNRKPRTGSFRSTIEFQRPSAIDAGARVASEPLRNLPARDVG